MHNTTAGRTEATFLQKRNKLRGISNSLANFFISALQYNTTVCFVLYLSGLPYASHQFAFMYHSSPLVGKIQVKVKLITPRKMTRVRFKLPFEEHTQVKVKESNFKALWSTVSKGKVNVTIVILDSFYT